MNDVTIKAYGKRVLIRPEEQEEKSPGGIIVPKDHKDTSTGVVVSAGELVEQFLAQHDRVLYFSKSGVEVVNNGQKLLLVSPENILAILPQ